MNDKYAIIFTQFVAYVICLKLPQPEQFLVK